MPRPGQRPGPPRLSAGLASPGPSATRRRSSPLSTVVDREGRLVGYNTDAAGFIRALTDFTGCGFDCHGKKAVILGTGGAARAAAVGLLENGVGELALLGRTHGRVDALVNHLRALDSGERREAMGGDGSPAGGMATSPPRVPPPPSPTRVQWSSLGGAARTTIFVFAGL